MTGSVPFIRVLLLAPRVPGTYLESLHLFFLLLAVSFSITSVSPQNSPSVSAGPLDPVLQHSASCASLVIFGIVEFLHEVSHRGLLPLPSSSMISTPSLRMV